MEDEVFKLTLQRIEVTDNGEYVAVFDLRLRTETTWDYTEGLRMGVGSVLYVRDGQGCDYLIPPLANNVRLPRGVYDAALNGRD